MKIESKWINMDLGEGIRKALAKITRSTIIDAKVIREFNKELQKILISSDVEVELVLKFTKDIEDKALKSKPPAGLAPTDYITNIVYEELVKLMGITYVPKMQKKRILLMGLYGSGKTTTAAKLAKYYQDRGMSAGVICCDVSRPAAYEQLETLSKNANIAFFGTREEKDAAKIARIGLEKLKDKQVIICDTSGRSSLDNRLIEELKEVAKEFHPDEKVLVISADIGQVAGKLARAFDSAVDLSGVIVTKMDGSGKGGGALSAANAAEAHVMFIGTGEKLASIESYSSEKFIGGLLGMPDIASLVTNVQEAIKEANIKPEEMEVNELNFDSFYTQLKTMGKMGSLKSVFGMMGAPDMPKDAMEQSEVKLKKFKDIIASMTKEERMNERMLHEPGRIKRIASGSGTSERDVHSLMTDFNKMKKVFDSLKNDRGFKKKFAKFM